MIWDRDYGSESPKCEDWNKTRKLLGVDNIVIGHTIQDNIINYTTMQYSTFKHNNVHGFQSRAMSSAVK